MTAYIGEVRQEVRFKIASRCWIQILNLHTHAGGFVTAYIGEVHLEDENADAAMGKKWYLYDLSHFCDLHEVSGWWAMCSDGLYLPCAVRTFIYHVR